MTLNFSTVTLCKAVMPREKHLVFLPLVYRGFYFMEDRKPPKAGLGPEAPAWLMSWIDLPGVGRRNAAGITNHILPITSPAVTE